MSTFMNTSTFSKCRSVARCILLQFQNGTGNLRFLAGTASELAHFDCVHKLGGTCTKCRLCLRAGSDIY